MRKNEIVTVTNSYGQEFTVEQLVRHEDIAAGLAIIESFEWDTESNEIKANTTKGWAHIDFIAPVNIKLENEKKSSEEWQKINPKHVVLDPDGWDRANFEGSWNEEITYQEYLNRLQKSTVINNL